MPLSEGLCGNGRHAGNGRHSFVFLPKNAEQRRAAELCRTADVTFLTGRAGTAKTHIALAVALEWLEQGLVKGLVLVRPQVPSGERMGFLPGTVDEKYLPWLKAIEDCLENLTFTPAGGLSPDSFLRRYVELAPLAMMRGRTFKKKAVILDEAQNCSAKQLRMFLSRLGDGSRAILTGDVEQCDRPSTRLEAFARCLEDVSVEGENGKQHRIGWQQLRKVVRGPLVEEILRRTLHLEEPADGRRS